MAGLWSKVWPFCKTHGGNRMPTLGKVERLTRYFRKFLWTVMGHPASIPYVLKTVGNIQWPLLWSWPLKRFAQIRMSCISCPCFVGVSFLFAQRTRMGLKHTSFFIHSQWMRPTFKPNSLTERFWFVILMGWISLQNRWWSEATVRNMLWCYLSSSECISVAQGRIRQTVSSTERPDQKRKLSYLLPRYPVF